MPNKADYSNVEKKPLKFKSDSGKVSKKSKKKRKKKNNVEKVEITTQQEQGEKTQPVVKYDHLTKAERKFREIQEKQKMKRIVERASTTHRDRVEEFNRHLDSLSEHYDIPKVSWTK